MSCVILVEEEGGSGMEVVVVVVVAGLEDVGVGHWVGSLKRYSSSSSWLAPAVVLEVESKDGVREVVRDALADDLVSDVAFVVVVSCRTIQSVLGKREDGEMCGRWSDMCRSELVSHVLIVPVEKVSV